MVFVHKRIDGSWPLGNAPETRAIAFIDENNRDLHEKTAHPSRFVLLAEEWGFEPQLEQGPTISFRN